MSRRALVLCSLLFAALLSPAMVSAGDESDPELTDPAGDQTEPTLTDCDAPVDDLCDGDPGSIPEADILAAWIQEPNSTAFNVTVQTAAAVGSEDKVAISFIIRPTENSTLDSAGMNITIDAEATGTTLSSGPANTTVSQDGDKLTFTFTRNDTGAAGGDMIADLTVSTVGQNTASGDIVGTGTYQSTDDASGSRNYTLSRPPIVADMAFTVGNGTILEIPAGNYTNFTAANATQMERTFNGTTVETMDPDATITYNVGITNTGTDKDTVTITLFDPEDMLGTANITVTFPGNEAPVGPSFTVELLPNAIADLSVEVLFVNATLGSHSVILSATSTRGASTAAALSATLLPQPVPPVAPPPGPPPTDNGTGDPAKSGPILDVPFLRDIAEGLGMADALGDWAEAVILAILLLLIILLIILLLALLSGGAVKIVVDERSLSGKPGTEVTFPVEVRNKKGAPRQVVIDIEGDPEWPAQVEFPDAPEAEDDMGRRVLNLEGKGELGSSHSGALRVMVPEAATDGEVDKLSLHVAPLDADGKTGRGSKAGLKVAASGGVAAKGVPLRLSSVSHDPEHPTEGEIVETTATLENDSADETMAIRVVLNVDGQDLQEEVIEIPPASARGVIFTWRPDAGSSKVRVRLYPA